MRQVWKFPLDDKAGIGSYEVPRGSSLLTLDFQNGKPVAWFLVDVDGDEVTPHADTWHMGYFGTGWNCGVSGSEYVVTRQQGSFVWHFFAWKDK